MTSPSPLQYGYHYHVYNRGNNRGDIFFEERNYRHFLRLYAKYVLPVADTYAYCLLRNHFHLLVRIRRIEEQKAYAEDADGEDADAETLGISEPFKPKKPSQQFSNLFNAYAKAINRAFGRTGSLFENPFGRVLVASDAHMSRVITYIHQNPQKHGFVEDFREWPYSSYHAILTQKPTRIERGAVLDWFGGAEAFRAAHRGAVDERQVSSLVPDDFD